MNYYKLKHTKMNRLKTKQLHLLEETFEDGKSDRESMHNAVSKTKEKEL